MAVTQVLKGKFCVNLEGLEYETPTISGLTNSNGEFQYHPGEALTFSIGGIVLGSARGGERLTPAHLVLEVGGDVKKITNRKVTNLSRFLQSLNKAECLEDGITITDEIRNIVKRYRYKIDYDQSEEAFASDQAVIELVAELQTTLRSGAQARNHLRRTLRGIKKLTDVQIPTRDGSYVLADVYRPIEEGKYPVIMSYGGYGKAFWFGCVCNDDDLLKREKMEDDYFEGFKSETPFIPFHFEIAGEVPPPELPPPGTPLNPMLPHVSENFEVANTVDWVPNGYVVIRVDERGSGKTPGLFEQFSLHEAEDYYDSIEWAAKQTWSNGNIGLYGGSYYAMNMFNVSQLQPPSLKAMIPIMGDIDSYRDYVYPGGLYNPFNFIAKNCCGEWKGVDWIRIAQANPFCDPAVYGPRGSICISSDASKITAPFWTAMGMELPVHTRGTSEAFIHAASREKKLTILSEPGIHFWMYAPEFLEQHKAFFDYWLKGIDNGIMNDQPVQMMIRTGWGGYYWQDEQEWPLARTEYTKYYLDTALSPMKMGKTLPSEEMSSSYSADAQTGISLLTDPMVEDTVIAGYIKLVGWVSSTSHDMAISALIRVIDENNMEVPYAIDLSTTRAFVGGHFYPLGKGGLKVSHRKLDPGKSTVYRPYHTHLREDHQPLSAGEVEECEVEIWPTTALIKKGWRIKLDLQPGLDPLDTSYQSGSLNTIYTGPRHQSYLQLPVIPKKGL